MKNDVYEMITERIIEQLNQGVIPWQKPWTGVRSGAFNRITKRPYSLLNQMLLGGSGEWATFKQWSDLGGKVKKGEKSHMIVFWKVNPKQARDAEGNPKTDDDGNPVIIGYPVLKYYNVFEVSQVEGVEPLPEEELTALEPVDAAEDVISDYVKRTGLTFEERKSNEAYYQPSFDKVVVPLKDQFDVIEEYYSTTFHELTHSTGHKSRLNRFEEGAAAAAFGSESYSKEELVAEIGAATLVNHLGLETKKSFRNSTAYIQSWLNALKNDKKLIISASARAEKAVNLILGIE